MKSRGLLTRIDDSKLTGFLVHLKTEEHKVVLLRNLCRPSSSCCRAPAGTSQKAGTRRRCLPPATTTRKTAATSWYVPIFARATCARRQLDDITIRVVSKALQLEPGKKIIHQFLLYPWSVEGAAWLNSAATRQSNPELVDRYADTLHLSTMTDYRSAGPIGWFSPQIMWTDILIATTRFMHWLLYWIHRVLPYPNYGLTIIVLTFLVRGAMFPVSRRSALVSQRMQALAPEMKKLQEKYKDDPQAKTAAVMELYRKHGVNPFGSCLPMVSCRCRFSWALLLPSRESIHFRLAHFLWIDNLAAPDMLFHWGDGIPIISDPDNYSGGWFSIFYLGPYFNLLPVIAAVLMILQQKMLMPPAADEQQEMQQKMMKYMAVFFGIMFYKVAAGLCIYFIVSSVWGLCERKLLPKKTAVVATPVASAAAASGKPVRGSGGQTRQEGEKTGYIITKSLRIGAKRF